MKVMESFPVVDDSAMLGKQVEKMEAAGRASALYSGEGGDGFRLRKQETYASISGRTITTKGRRTWRR